MVKEVKMFTVVCDGCGKDVNAGSEYSCWSEPDPSIETASESGWLLFDSVHHYCPDCFYYDDDDCVVLTPKNKSHE